MTWLSDVVEGAREIPSQVREALWVRGVSNDQIRDFEIGHLPGRLPAGVAVSKDFKTWWEGHRWRLRNSYLFPLTSTTGEVKGFQFRNVDPKIRGYLDYYELKDEPAFFGLAQAMPAVWETETLWLVEGVFDLLPVQRHVPGVVSTLHAGVSQALWRVIRRIAKTLVIAYDTDGAGLKVAYDIAKTMRQYFEIQIVKFPRVPMDRKGREGAFATDPNDIWRVWGDDHLGAFLKQQITRRF